MLCAMMAVCFAQEQTEKAANTENAAGGELEGRGYYGGYGGYRRFGGYGGYYRRPFYGGYGGYGGYGYGYGR